MLIESPISSLIERTIGRSSSLSPFPAAVSLSRYLYRFLSFSIPLRFAPGSFAGLIGIADDFGRSIGDQPPAGPQLDSFTRDASVNSPRPLPGPHGLPSAESSSRSGECIELSVRGQGRTAQFAVIGCSDLNH